MIMFRMVDKMDREKKRRAMISVLLMMVAILPVAYISAGQTITANNALSMMNLRVSPQPVVSGDNITVSFQLFNSYSSQLQNVNVQLVSENPIINVSPAGSVVMLNAVGSGLYGGIGYNQLTYRLHIPSKLAAGEYTIDVVATYETDQAGFNYLNLPAESVMPINIYVYGTPKISLSASASQQIQPGVPFAMEVSALNTGTDMASNVTVTMANSPGFTPIGPYSLSVGAIPAGGAAPSSFTLQPNENISSGRHYLNFDVGYTTQLGDREDQNISVPIEVAINKPDIVASIEGATPQQLYIGHNQTLAVLLQNIGNGEAKNISASFDSGNGITVGGPSDFFIGSLGAGASITENLFISADNGSGGTARGLLVALRYQTANHADNITENGSIPVNVEKSADFNVTSESGNLYPGATYVPVTFTISNTGNEAAEEVSLSLQSIYPITAVNPDAYVNTLLPGESTNVTFYVSVDTKGNAGTYPVVLYEQWRQANGGANQQYTSSNNYYAAVGARSSSSGKNSYWVYGVAVIAIMAIAYLVFAKKGKKG